jgi:hypothetical protein
MSLIALATVAQYIISVSRKRATANIRQPIICRSIVKPDFRGYRIIRPKAMNSFRTPVPQISLMARAVRGVHLKVCPPATEIETMISMRLSLHAPPPNHTTEEGETMQT